MHALWVHEPPPFRRLTGGRCWVVCLRNYVLASYRHRGPPMQDMSRGTGCSWRRPRTQCSGPLVLHLSQWEAFPVELHLNCGLYQW
jgi:hypothetical protein